MLHRSDPAGRGGHELLPRARQCVQLSRQVQRAKTDYDKALALGYYPIPALRETADANLGRGYASLRLGHYQDAIDDFNAALKVVPQSSNAHAWRGTAYQGLGKGPEAVAAYKAALTINPKNESALGGLKSLGVPPP
jgi:tetratricopeptide (TPR) repeat protein